MAGEHAYDVAYFAASEAGWPRAMAAVKHHFAAERLRLPFSLAEYFVRTRAASAPETGIDEEYEDVASGKMYLAVVAGRHRHRLIREAKSAELLRRYRDIFYLFR